jgi:glycosyltransferase involved in cell wall biosynthesis
MGENLNKKKIIISGINFFEGGPLTILKNNLKYANDFLSSEYEIIALVHKSHLFNHHDFININFIEFPKSRISYFIRIYLEYFYFKKLSKKWKPYLWFSLHDITPNVYADKRVVYCHNPSPFKNISIKDLFFQPTLFFFSMFYIFLYKINIKKNDFVIVQQKWIKDEFVKLFDLPNKSVIVSYPEQNKVKSVYNELNNEVFTFFYPALARPFKNFEIIGEAIKLLEKNNIHNFQVLLTISGNENNYSNYIFKKFKELKKIKFLGVLSFEEVNEKYNKTDALLFPSTLETWGLPISEFKTFNRPIILSKLPYAFETLGEYEKALFFDPFKPDELANKMHSLISGNVVFDKPIQIKEDVLFGWDELYNKLLKK